MKTNFEILPDEILLLICQYLSDKETIQAFINLNFRLNCTISEYTRSLIVKDDEDKECFELIQTQLRSLTVKNNLLTSKEIYTAINIEELNLIRTSPCNLINFKYLTDLNIHFIPAFESILILYSQNIHLHSIYLESNQGLTIPLFDPPKFASIKQLAISVDSGISFLRILRTCPDLICLNLTLDQFELDDSNLNLSSKDKLEHLSIFSIRFPYEYIVDFNSLKCLLSYLPSTLEYLSISIQTKDKICLNGQTWEICIKEIFPQLIRLEFFIIFHYERAFIHGGEPRPKSSDVLQTFKNSFWSTIVPQRLLNYSNHNELCIYTEPIPIVARRRYFLN